MTKPRKQNLEVNGEEFKGLLDTIDAGSSGRRRGYGSQRKTDWMAFMCLTVAVFFLIWMVVGVLSGNCSSQGDYVDVFVTSGQSNAWWPRGKYKFGLGVEDVLTKSGLVSNPIVVVKTGSYGRAIASWFLPSEGPQVLYKDHFFNPQEKSGALEEVLLELRRQAKIPRFRALFWFQGETDGVGGTPDDVYEEIWNAMIHQMEVDLSSKEFFKVLNTVGNSGENINVILRNIVDADDHAVLFDTQVFPYRTNSSWVHGYDHFAVGQANARLFLEAFGEELRKSDCSS